MKAGGVWWVVVVWDSLQEVNQAVVLHLGLDLPISGNGLDNKHLFNIAMRISQTLTRNNFHNV
jgi:hypothetical protein